MYVEPNNVRLMEQAISWAAGKGTTYCANGVEIANKAR
jgi:hypothetical protein